MKFVYTLLLLPFFLLIGTPMAGAAVSTPKDARASKAASADKMGFREKWKMSKAIRKEMKARKKAAKAKAREAGKKYNRGRALTQDSLFWLGIGFMASGFVMRLLGLGAFLSWVGGIAILAGFIMLLVAAIRVFR